MVYKLIGRKMIKMKYVLIQALIIVYFVITNPEVSDEVLTKNNNTEIIMETVTEETTDLEIENKDKNVHVPSKDKVETEIKTEVKTEVEQETEVIKEDDEYSMPSTSGFKSYMSYKAITSKSSPQYKLQSNYAYTGNYGIRQVDDRYCIAIGTFSGAAIGTYVDLVLENGTVIPCIIGDFKANIHTDSKNIVTMHNGCISEFIIDADKLHATAKKMGDISYCNKEWNSPVESIVVYDKNVFN